MKRTKDKPNGKPRSENSSSAAIGKTTQAQGPSGAARWWSELEPRIRRALEKGEQLFHGYWPEDTHNTRAELEAGLAPFEQFVKDAGAGRLALEALGPEQREEISKHLQGLEDSLKGIEENLTDIIATREYRILDYRLEHPNFRVVQVEKDGEVRWEVRGDLSAPAPPLRESKYLKKEQCIEIYRWMLLNRRMETALENLYKQGKVVGGVYFGLGQEGCSCASAYALGKDDWLAPMIRNQGSMLVRGFPARDIMMQYMAKAGSPTKGRDASSHFGDHEKRNVVAPISMLGDLIPVMAGVALGARLQGRNIAVMTYIGDGGQSTGVFHEGLNFAAVQKLGLILIVENNLWGYSTPAERQFLVKDLADRAVSYGIPGAIVDGTDPLQVYDVCHEAAERARRGDGSTLIEAKMMRMKGHAIHDAAGYVPKELFEYWHRRDPIARFEKYLLEKNWLTAEENKNLIAKVERQLEDDRNAAEASPMPKPESAEGGVYCDGKCHDIKPKYGGVKVAAGRKAAGKLKETEAALHFK